MHSLYQAELKKHYTAPIGLNRLIETTHSSEGYNPTCGDEINLHLQINQHQIMTNIAFNSDSCAICTASASLLCQIIKETHTDYLLLYFSYLKSQLKNKPTIQTSFSNAHHLETKQLNCLTPVHKHPSRINCALLPWQTALAALNNPVN